MVVSALSTWVLGFPEKALRISDAKDAHARRRGHPFDLGWALTFGAHLFDYLREPDEWLKRVAEAIAQVEQPGWEERYYYAEILRIKGWLRARTGDPEGAERAYLASLDWARTQQAKSWELRTATSYARLMRDQGRVEEAYELLAPVYGWFTEGCDTRDLKEAKVLLEELDTSAAPASAVSA